MLSLDTHTLRLSGSCLSTQAETWLTSWRSAVGFPDRDQRMDLESDAMYCPKCGDVLVEADDTFKCIRGDMEMSRHLAAHLFACFVSGSELPKEPPPPDEITYKGGVGGDWFCPGCGVAMHQQIPWAVRCPGCRRSIWQFLHELIEFHPHRGDGDTFR